MTELLREPPSPKTGKTTARTTPRILLIDDEPAALQSAQTALAGGEYQVVTCKSAVEALRLLETESFDCIVADIVMPVMDGYELVRTIRTGTRAPNVPLLMLTRKRSREDVAAALEAGADDYILKPLDDQVFLDKIEANVKKGEAKRHIFEHALHGDSIPAELKISARIIAVSEADVTIALPFPVIPAMALDLTTSLFEDIDIAPPVMNLLHCQRTTGRPAGAGLIYEARYAFMGIPENDSRKIRAWLHRQAILRRK